MPSVPTIITEVVDTASSSSAVLSVDCDPATDAVFSGDFRSPCSVGLTIRNRSAVVSRFRVKTNHPGKYTALPVEGALPAHSSVAVALTVAPFEYRPGETKEGAFLLMVYAESPANITYSEKDQWASFSSSELVVRRIRCFFDHTPAAGSDRDVTFKRNSVSFNTLDAFCSNSSNSSNSNNSSSSPGASSSRFLSPFAADNSGDSSGSSNSAHSAPPSRRGSAVEETGDQKVRKKARRRHSGGELNRRHKRGDKGKDSSSPTAAAGDEEKKVKKKKEAKDFEDNDKTRRNNIIVTDTARSLTQLGQSVWGHASGLCSSFSSFLPSSDVFSGLTGEAKLAAGFGAAVCLLVAFEVACYLYY